MEVRVTIRKHDQELLGKLLDLAAEMEVPIGEIKMLPTGLSIPSALAVAAGLIEGAEPPKPKRRRGRPPKKRVPEAVQETLWDE